MIQRYPDPQSVASTCAERIVEIATEALRDDYVFHLVLSGGSTPKLVFSELVKMKSWTAECHQNTHLWFGDERSVPNEHEESNVRMAREFLINHCQFPEKNIHLVDGGANDLAAEAKRYEEEIKSVVSKGNQGIPAFDLVMLGMGDDGHTASLFPRTKALTIHDRLFVENEVPQKETMRLTMTYPLLNAAHEVMLIVTGANKAPILEEIMPDSPGKYPVELITGNGQNVIWFVDDSAMPENLV